MRIQNIHFPNWKAVEEAVSQAISGSSDPFEPATVSNVHDLIDACRDLCSVPESVEKGYWSTICFSWENLEVEVFDDHYEFYRFMQGQTDIEHFSHSSGAKVPVELMNHLPKRSSLRD